MKITVVGAGIIGCSVAHELASRGALVHVVDMRGTGLGATQASAGILAPYVEGHIDALLRIGVCSLSLYDAFVTRASEGAAQPIEYERTGTLQVAVDEDEAAELEAAAQRLARGGVAHSLMDGNEARRLEPSLSPRIRTALLLPQHGYVRVAQLTSALAAAAASCGTSTTAAVVQHVEPRSGVVIVTTPAGGIESDAVILAAGSWTSGLAQPLVTPPPVRPIRGQLLHLHFTQRPLSRVVWGTDCYLVPWHDGSLLVGATVEDAGFDESATAAGVTHLLRASARFAHDHAYSAVRGSARRTAPRHPRRVASDWTIVNNARRLLRGGSLSEWRAAVTVDGQAGGGPGDGWPAIAGT